MSKFIFNSLVLEKNKMQSSCDYLSLKTQPSFKVVQDSIRGFGLQATRTIRKGEAVVIYYGKRLRGDGSHLELYFINPEKYLKERAPYIRSNGNQCIDAHEIDYQKINNMNLLGVYVNDIQKPMSLDDLDLKTYLESQEKCNLEVGPETRDYPVYFAKRRIKKGEHLTIHYGLAYWLLQLGVDPSKIGDYLEKIE